MSKQPHLVVQHQITVIRRGLAETSICPFQFASRRQKNGSVNHLRAFGAIRFEPTTS